MVETCNLPKRKATIAWQSKERKKNGREGVGDREGVSLGGPRERPFTVLDIVVYFLKPGSTS